MYRSPAQLKNLEKGRPYRFKKGQSGNPSGRPRERTATQVSEVVTSNWPAASAAQSQPASAPPAPISQPVSAPDPPKTAPKRTAEELCAIQPPPTMRPQDYAALERASTPESREGNSWRSQVDWDRFRRGY